METSLYDFWSSFAPNEIPFLFDVLTEDELAALSVVVTFLMNEGE